MNQATGVTAEREHTYLTSRALEFLAAGPADVVDLIGHVCNLPGAPRIVAEHMAQAMFSGRNEFVRDAGGMWSVSDPSSFGSEISPERSNGTDSRIDSLRSHTFAVVDVETTGGQPHGGDRITEIAAAVVRDGEIVELFETLVNPQRPIPYFITQLTNITWDMVKDAPTFDRVAPEVLRVLEGNVFVAHNAMFDWRFVTSEVSRSTGRKLQGRRLCTVKIARKVLPQLSRRSLDHVARYYGVEIHGRHRAAGDALATAKCLLRMLSDLGDRGCATWGDLETLLRAPAVQRKKRRAPGLPTPVLRDTTA